MTKVIQTMATNGTGPRVVAVPGAAGYAARYVAAHLDQEAGSVVPSWVATSVGPTLTLVGGSSQLTVGDDGNYFVTSSGGSNAGGRLLGPHLTQRPFTVGAVVKASAGFGFLGMTGVEVGRNATGAWYQRSTTGATVTSTETGGGWATILMRAHADGTHSLTVNGHPTDKVTLGAPTPTYGGLYFGGSAVGQAASVREIIVWHRDLSPAATAAALTYLRQRYGN